MLSGKKTSSILSSIGKRVPFEIAIGMNGRIWINSSSTENTIFVYNAIKNSENLDEDKCINLIGSL